MKLRNKRRNNRPRLHERGQAMVLVAAGMIGIVAIVGLAIDAGIVFSQLGHLRRGVDAAALSAANQIREGITTTAIRNSAKEIILLNLPDTNLDVDVQVDTCDTDNTIPGCNDTFSRKLARVEANLGVGLTFLPIIGWDELTITADAISETASVELVLVLDNSTSMAYDTAGIAEPGGPISDSELNTCNNNPGDPNNGCQPFEDVRAAAHTLVDRMYLDYDRIAVVAFSRFAGVVSGTPGNTDEAPNHDADLHLTSTEVTIDAALDALYVYPNISATNICPNWTYRSDGQPDDPRGCMRTNVAAGLAVAGHELQANGRADAVWVVVILSDGVGNAAYQIPVDFSALTAAQVNWYCPQGFWRADTTDNRVADHYQSPWCTDGDPTSGYTHPTLPADPDPEDLTRYYTDWVGCYPSAYGNDCSMDGLGAIIFSIGLGDALTNLNGGIGVQDADYGETIMRYIARVGYDGNPAADSNSDPCWNSGTGVSCGNYYYSPDGSDLTNIFNEIADKIFTRLVH